jgi:hypothetical protein
VIASVVAAVVLVVAGLVLLRVQREREWAHGGDRLTVRGEVALAIQHYDWLGGVAEANYTDVNGVTNFPTAAVFAPAAEAGTATAWFRQWGDGPIPFADAKRDIVVALVYVGDSGEVRWARRIFG